MGRFWINVLSYLGKQETFIRQGQHPLFQWVLVSTRSTYLEAWLGLVHIPPAQDPHLVMRLVIGQLSWQRIHTYGLEKKNRYKWVIIITS